MTTPVVEAHVQRGRWNVVRDWVSKGPFAIAASTLQGGMNYFIILYLTYFESLSATGEYRTLFSYYSLLALASMMESNKIYIRSVLTRDRMATTSLFANKLMFGCGAFIIIAIIWALGVVSEQGHIPDSVLIIAGMSALIYPFDFYIAHLQARRRFQRLFLIESVKYTSAFAAFITTMILTHDLTVAVIVQLAVLGLCNFIFFMWHSRHWVQFRTVVPDMARLVRGPAAQQARTYSFANMFPASLEHVDKLLVGWVFGLEFLGVYTLAYSTGRFLYNILKPAMYVYYRKFVDQMPGWPILIRVSAAFSAVGVINMIVFLLAIEMVPQMQRFESGKWSTSILFLGYGIGILHAVYSQAFSLNKESVAAHSFHAHFRATACSLVLLFAALLSPKPLALILLALQYPLRDGLSVLLMHRYRVRHRPG